MKPAILIYALAGLAFSGGSRHAARPVHGDDSRSAPAAKIYVDVKDDQPAAGMPLNQLPGVWIGVRVTPVPEALAAHLEREGMMLANLVADSPADRAGLERYDVVVSFGGKPIGSMQDLVDAIAQTGAGNEAEIVVLRKGQEQTLRITPAERPAEGTYEYKYPEPKPEDASNFVRYFGHRLQRDPQGNWVLEPLGRLRDLPDPLKDMLKDSDPAWQQWLDRWRGFQTDPFKPAPDHGWPRWPSLDQDQDAKVEIFLKVERDGSTISIQRSPDGSLSVERTDPNGERRSATYESLDQLREQDSEAYDVYRRYSGYRTGRMILVPPGVKDLPDLQFDFQAKIEQQLEKARERMRKALEDAGRAREDAGRTLKRWKSRRQDDAGATSEFVSIINNNGRISITIEKDGDRQHYEFDSLEQLKSSEPELYERFKDMIE